MDFLVIHSKAIYLLFGGGCAMSWFFADARPRSLLVLGYLIMGVTGPMILALLIYGRMPGPW
jgi:hypothetical protein